MIMIVSDERHTINLEEFIYIHLYNIAIIYFFKMTLSIYLH